MQKILSYIRKPKPKKVIYIPVPEITPKIVMQVEKTLLKINQSNAAGILVGINSGGKQSLIQSEKIGTALEQRAAKLKIPLITHAEDSCMMASFHLLMYGQTVLADTSSMIGNLGFRTTPYRLKEFTEHWEVQAKYVHHGDNKVRFNRFKDLREEDVQWIMNIWHKLLETIYDQA